jgi:hypothetical protein
VEFPDLVTFSVDLSTSRIGAHPLRGVPVRTVRHLFLDSVLPMYLAERGDLVVHGNAVVYGRRSGVLLIGSSMSGKSTAAAALCAGGCRLLADDCVRIRRHDGRLVGMPGYASLRLWADAVEQLLATGRFRAGRALTHYAPQKRVIAGTTLASGPARLSRVYVLGRSPSISIERVRGAEAIELLLPHLFRLRTRGSRRFERELHQVTMLAGEVPVCRLRYPRRWSALGGIQTAIARDLITSEP